MTPRPPPPLSVPAGAGAAGSRAGGAWMWRSRQVAAAVGSAGPDFPIARADSKCHSASGDASGCASTICVSYVGGVINCH